MSDTIDSAPLDAEEASELREKHYNATIIERIDAHSDLARFRIRPDLPIPPFKPGQYVALGIGNWEPRLPGTQEELVPENRSAESFLAGPTRFPVRCLTLTNEVAPVNSIDYLEFYITLVRSADSPEKKPPVLTPRLFQMKVGDRLEVQKKITGQLHARNLRA